MKDSIQFKRLENADLPGGCAWWGGVRDVWLVCGWLLVVVVCVVARLFDNEKSIPGKSPVRDCRFLADMRGRCPLGLYLLREGRPRLRSQVARGATTRWLLLGCSKLTSTLARAGLLSTIALGTELAELASWATRSLSAR